MNFRYKKNNFDFEIRKVKEKGWPMGAVETAPSAALPLVRG